MTTLNSRVILAKNIKLDKDYKNILTYSESEMVDLCEDNAVYSDSNYQFVKVGENQVLVGANYSTCLQANYIAIQNPNYQNKWFFGFIDQVEYNSEASCIIHYTIDECSTWHDYWTPKTCFVIREHVNDDTPGKNTVPEGLETGEYISANLQPETDDFGDTCFCVTTSEQQFQGYQTLNEVIPTGLFYYGFTSLTGVDDFIKSLADDSIVNSVFVCPKDFFSNWTQVQDIRGDVSTSVRFSLNQKDILITRPDYVGKNYVPRNNKLKCFPYSFLQVSNRSGTIVNYNWEDFNLLLNQDQYKFKLGCVLTPGCSGYAYPIDYKNILNNIDDGISFGKFPVGGWNSDTYTNWLTENGLNASIGVVGGIAMAGIGIAGAAATGGLSLALAGAALSGAVSVSSSLASLHSHSLAPDQAKGNSNLGDYTFGYGFLELEFKRISIKDEYCSILDGYFDRMGYKVNKLKVPNINGRENWNFVQIGLEENIGYSESETLIPVPKDSMQTINQVFRQGVTCWHNHNNLGNYSLSNNII